MVGFNSDEGSGLSDFGVVAQPPADAASYEALVRKQFGDLAKPYLVQYPSTDLTEAVFNAYRDSEFGWRMEHWADRMAAVKAPAWLYYFSHVSPTGEAVRWVSFGAGQRRLGAFHASEIAYVFNHPDIDVTGVAKVRPEDLQLANTMSDFWVNFARTGNPNGPGLPVWAPYIDAHRSFMQFDRVAHPGLNLQPGSLELHRKIDERRAQRGLTWDGGQAGLLGHTE
jgi:para-nitrobenzyl esterase